MRRFLVTFGWLCCMSFVYAAPGGSFCGRTLDSASLPVPRADVRLYSRDSALEFSAESDRTGQYCFQQVPSGDYLVEARAAPSLAAAPQRVAVTAETANLPDLVLRIAPVSTQVTVTGSGSPQAASETAKELETIDVASALARGQDNLSDALDELPGVRVTQEGGPGAFTTIQLRGLRTFDTAVLIDGMQLRDVSATQADASSFISDLWFTDTSRVEVLQGAGASLYGTNSIGGVINLLTDPGGGPFHGDVDIQGGMLGQFRGLAHVAGSALHDRLYYSVGGGHVNVTEGVDGDDRYRNTGGLASLDYVVSPRIHTGVRVLGADIFGQLNNTPTSVPTFAPSAASGPIPAIPLASSQIPTAENGLPYANGNANFIPSVDDPDYYRSQHFTSTLAFWEHAVTPTLSYRASYQTVDKDTDYVNGPAGLGYQPLDRTSTVYSGRTDTAQVTAEWQATRSQLVAAGYQFDRESFDNPSYVGQAPAFLSNTRVSQTSNTAYLQDQIQLLKDRLQVSVSGRWESFNLKAPFFSGAFPVYAGASAVSPPSAWVGDVSAAYFFRSSGTKIRSHAGNAYRAPSLYERFGTYFDGSTFTAYGDPRLAPERAISVDGGIDQYLFGEKLKVSATYFYTRLQETIAFDLTGAIVNPASDPYGRFMGYYNTPGGLARGAEVSAEAKLPGRTFVRSAYTYTNSRDRISEYSDGFLDTPQIVPQMFSASIAKQFGAHWDAEIDCLVGNHYYYPFSGNQYPYYSIPLEFEAPRRANLSVGYTLPVGEGKRIRIYSRFDNLNGQTYYEEGFLTPGFVARGGMQFFF
ncbi:MAG: TonB-dependent receptor [Acidobacteriaceae bacterium]|nr:TonB-dependent receptor [Acidobacteriaceae bacterium]